MDLSVHKLFRLCSLVTLSSITFSVFCFGKGQEDGAHREDGFLRDEKTTDMRTHETQDKLGPLVLGLIQTYWDGLEKENPGGLKAPYTVQYEKAGKALSFVGADHRPKTLGVVKREFDRLKPTVVIVEGMWMANADQAKINARADECKKQNDCSENLYSVNLARENNVPYVVGETSAIDIRNKLLDAGYTQKDILARFLLGDWDSSINEKTLPTWFDKRVKKIQTTYGLNDTEFSLADLKTWYAENVTPDSALHKFDGTMSPAVLPPANRLEKMWTAVNRIRNEGLMRNIDSEVRMMGARVLVVYGSGHWLETSPALKKMLGNYLGLVDAKGNIPACPQVAQYSGDFAEKELSKIESEKGPTVQAFRKDGKELRWITSWHWDGKSVDPKDGGPKTLRLIDNQIKAYRPEVVVIEGWGYRKVTQKQLNEFLENSVRTNYTSPSFQEFEAPKESLYLLNLIREKGLVEYLNGGKEGVAKNATKPPITIIFAEPTPHEFVQRFLAKGYSAKDILGWFLVQEYGYKKTRELAKQQGFGVWLKSALQKIRTEYPLENAFDEEEFRAWVKDVVKINNVEDLPRTFFPNGEPTTFLERIAVDQRYIRDTSIARATQRALEHGNRVLGVYGSGHFPTLRAAFEALMGQPVMETAR